MTISNKIAETEQKIEEMSAAAGGAMSFSPQKQEEDKLREVIRKSIKIYSRKKSNLSENELQEQKLRNIISNLIKEAKQSSFPRPQSTLEGILSKFFNSSGIYESVRDQFYDLQTDREEKTGFIKTFLERSNETMMIPNADELEQDENLQEEESEEESEEEEEPVSREKDILDKWGAFVPSEVEDDLKLKLKPKNTKSQEKKTKKDDGSSEQIESFEKRGSNSAVEIFEQRIKDELKKIMLKLIGPEKEEARILIMQNFTAWFDMWTEDSDEMDKFLIQCLEQNNIPIPDQFSQPEPDTTEPPVEDDISSDVEPETDNVVDNLEEEDLFGLLEADLD